MSVEVDALLTSRGALIEKLTAPDFSKKFGAVIGGAISPIIGAETYSVLSRPELYVLPAGSTVELPTGLDHLVAEEAQKAWQKLSTRMQNPDHFSTITAYSTISPHTWMKFDTTIPLLKEGRATLHLLEIDGIPLPLRIAIDKGDATILLKHDQLSDDDFVRLVSLLVKISGEEDATGETEEELESSIASKHKQDKAKQFLPLNLLKNSPEGFSQLVDSHQFSINPDRLMTREEASEWLGMANEVIKSNRAGQDVVVGEPNYGSHERVRAEVNFATGLTLNRVMLNPPDASESSVQFTDFLTSVKDGERELGFLACSISCQKTTAHLHIEFDHGAREIFYFNQWKQRQTEK